MGLILTRRPGEQIDMTLEDGRRIAVGVIAVRGNQVRMHIDAPRTITVDRSEITERKASESNSDD